VRKCLNQQVIRKIHAIAAEYSHISIAGFAKKRFQQKQNQEFAKKKSVSLKMKRMRRIRNKLGF
tara:strand:+ start:4495 stop:4686 length:192 start_codon:yes stop_codon:yes gene_type:complete